MTSPAAVMKLVVFFRSSKPPYNFWWSGVTDGHCAIRSGWCLLHLWRTCSVVWSSSPQFKTVIRHSCSKHLEHLMLQSEHLQVIPYSIVLRMYQADINIPNSCWLWVTATDINEPISDCRLNSVSHIDLLTFTLLFDCMPCVSRHVHRQRVKSCTESNLLIDTSDRLRIIHTRGVPIALHWMHVNISSYNQANIPTLINMVSSHFVHW